jgi:hypothetical protein
MDESDNVSEPNGNFSVTSVGLGAGVHQRPLTALGHSNGGEVKVRRLYILRTVVL